MQEREAPCTEVLVSGLGLLPITRAHLPAGRLGFPLDVASMCSQIWMDKGLDTYRPGLNRAMNERKYHLVESSGIALQGGDEC